MARKTKEVATTEAKAVETGKLDAKEQALLATEMNKVMDQDPIIDPSAEDCMERIVAEAGEIRPSDFVPHNNNAGEAMPYFTDKATALLKKIGIEVPEKVTTPPAKEKESAVAVKKGHLEEEPKAKAAKIEKKSRRPSLASVIKGAMKIVAEYKGKTHKADVTASGEIKYDGKVYTSPSSAGSAVTGKPCDGWKLWKYEAKKGELVLLDELRK